MKILLIGKTGQLGSSILAEPRGHSIIAPGRDELDIENSNSLCVAINNYSPDVVINTAAFHNLPLCETAPVRAFGVNCVAVKELAALCKQRDTLLVTFSTDYVFDGSKGSPYVEDDCPRPLQIYGITRLAGELAAAALAPNHSIVIRTCGLYGMDGALSKGGNFVDKRIADAAGGGPIEMGCDQRVSPTFTDDLAEAVLKLIEKPNRLSGLYHLVNEGECTWHEFTQAIYEEAGINVEVRPVDRKGLSGEMRRPLYSVLENTKARALGITLPSWRDGLQRYMAKKYGK